MSSPPPLPPPSGTTALCVISPSPSRPEATAVPTCLFQALPYAHLVDTLPYVDALTPEQNEEAKTLIQQELAVMNQERAMVRGKTGEGQSVEEMILHEYLEERFPAPQTPHLDDPQSLVGKELLRLKRGERMQKVDLASHYEAAPPLPSKSAETAEWRRGIADCEGLLEHLGLGQLNFELMNAHAVTTWNLHLQHLSSHVNHWGSALKRVREEVDEVSKLRKLEQVDCGNCLRNLRRTKEDYEERNKEILSALAALDEEVAQLQHKCRIRNLLPADYDSDPDEEEATWARPAGSRSSAAAASAPSTSSAGPVVSADGSSSAGLSSHTPRGANPRDSVSTTTTAMANGDISSTSYAKNVRGGDLFDSHHAGAPMAAIREEDDLIDYDEA